MTPLYLITVLYNSLPVLPDFISCLKGQTNQNWVLIIIDNASADKGLGYLEQVRDERFLIIKNPSNVGVAAANNQGICRALDLGAEWLVLLNNDITISADCFADCLRIANARNAPILAPLVTYADDPSRVWYAGGNLTWWPICGVVHWDMDCKLQKHNSVSLSCSYAPTCFLLIHRDVIHNVGLMWEPYFVYADDVDYMFRINKLKYKVWFEPSIIVRHRVGFSSGGALSEFSIFYGSRNAIVLMRRVLSNYSSRLQIIIFKARGFLAKIVKKKSMASYNVRMKGIKEGLTVKIR